MSLTGGKWRSGFFRWFLLLGLVSVSLRAGWTQEAYVWQRQWTPQVIESVKAFAPRLDGLQVLAADIHWTDGQPRGSLVPYDAPTLAALRTPLTLVMRIAPYAGPFHQDDKAARFIVEQADRLLRQARTEEVTVAEFQIDFDCAESKLDGYREWLLALRDKLSQSHPGVHLSFTALPVWLRHQGDFRQLAAVADSFVLQVHSLEKPTTFDAPISLCDPDRSRGWIAQAAAVGVPFRVALPTYGYEVIFDEAGRFQALVAEGPRPQWTAGTRVRIVRSDPVEMAKLARQLAENPPRHCLGIIWFRLPVDSDRLNWSQRTLETILDGQIPASGLTAHAQWSESGDGLATIYLENTGETALPFPAQVSLSWSDNPQTIPIAWDSNGIFAMSLDRDTRSARISTSALPASATLAPGQRLALGWLRFNQPVSLQVRLTDDF